MCLHVFQIFLRSWAILINEAINGAMTLAANLITLGPRSSRPVAFDGYKIRINDKACSVVIKGILSRCHSV